MKHTRILDFRFILLCLTTWFFLNLSTATKASSTLGQSISVATSNVASSVGSDLMLFNARAQIVSAVFTSLLYPFVQGYVDNIFFKPPTAKYGPNILFQPRTPHKDLFKGLIYPKNTKSKLDSYIARLDLAIKQKRELPSLLLMGAPGTGKTEIAKRIGNRKGFTYALMSGSSFKPFKEEKTTRLTKLFKWANSQSMFDKRKVVLFFDEAEIMFESRKTNTSKDHADFLSHFLSLTGSASKNYVIIIATNRPSLIDEAMLGRRLPSKIEVEKPREHEIVPLLDMFFANSKKNYPDMDFSLIEHKTHKLDIARVFSSFSPADIKPMVTSAFDDALIKGEPISTAHFECVSALQRSPQKDYLK